MKKVSFVYIVFLFFIFGCNTSKITTSWKSPGVSPQKYDKVLVLGLIKDVDRSIQDKMENHFVGDLTELGYTAVSALKEYGPKAFDNLNENAVLDKLKNTGVDAVITIILLDKKKENKYVPARSYYETNFWDYYGARYKRIYEPGYYVTDTKYYWESNFYELKNKSLIFSVQTQSFSPSNVENLGHQYGQMIVNKMVKEKVLMDKRKEE